MTDNTTDLPPDAHAEDECLLCAPGHHPNCEQYGVVEVLNWSRVPAGENIDEHLVSIPVCLAHFEAIEQFQRGVPVAEVDV